MHWKRAINPTQVRQKIVQVDIVQLCKRTHFGVINVDGNPGPLDFGFDVIGDIMSAETLRFDREPAKRIYQSVLPDKFARFLFEYHSHRFESLDLPQLPADRSDFDVHGALLDDKVQTNCNALHFAQS